MSSTSLELSGNSSDVILSRNPESSPTLAGIGTHTPSRILICRPNGRLGNTLLLTPLIQEVEALFPGAEIDIVTACAAAPDIFREFTAVRTLHHLPRLGVRHPLKVLAVFWRARQKTYDLIIDPCPRSWSGRFWTRTLRANVKIGFVSPLKKTGINYGVPITGAPLHIGKYPVYLLRRAAKETNGEDDSRTIFPLNIALRRSEKRFGRQKLSQLLRHTQSDDPVISVFANATGNKQLPVAWWQALLTSLTEQFPSLQIIEIVPGNGKALLPNYNGYFSTSVRQMASVMAATDCFISADCGVMHLGSASGTPTIGLFNITDPVVYAPYGKGSAAVMVEKSFSKSTEDEIVRLVRLALSIRKPPQLNQTR